jgi:hypothetical protein
MYVCMYVCIKYLAAQNLAPLQPVAVPQYTHALLDAHEPELQEAALLWPIWITGQIKTPALCM